MVMSKTDILVDHQVSKGMGCQMSSILMTGGALMIFGDELMKFARG